MRRQDRWKSGPRINNELSPTTESRSEELLGRYEKLLETIEKTVVDDRGRIYIPKSIRNRLKIRIGDKLLIVPNDDYLVIRKMKSLKERKLSIDRFRPERLTVHGRGNDTRSET